MDMLLWLGFVFACGAFALAGSNRSEILKLKREIDALKAEQEVKTTPRVTS
jgi:hypothetical protein